MSAPAAEPRTKQTILVAYDGSPAARRALVHAASLARRRCVVAVVNVIRNQSVSSKLVTSSDSDRQIQDRVLREAQVFLEDCGVECRTIAAVGDPSAEILGLVEELDARWLILGRGGHRHRVRRSTSMKLTAQATCGVVVVR